MIKETNIRMQLKRLFAVSNEVRALDGSTVIYFELGQMHDIQDYLKTLMFRIEIRVVSSGEFYYSNHEFQCYLNPTTSGIMFNIWTRKDLIAA